MVPFFLFGEEVYFANFIILLHILCCYSYKMKIYSKTLLCAWYLMLHRNISYLPSSWHKRLLHVPTSLKNKYCHVFSFGQWSLPASCSLPSSPFAVVIGAHLDRKWLPGKSNPILCHKMEVNCSQESPKLDMP